VAKIECHADVRQTRVSGEHQRIADATHHRESARIGRLRLDADDHIVVVGGDGSHSVDGPLPELLAIRLERVIEAVWPEPENDVADVPRRGDPDSLPGQLDGRRASPDLDS
jgi:hypothetical protein